MRRYEMVLVANPTIPEEKHDKLVTGIETMIAEKKGQVHKVDRWGRRKLAYPIDRHNEGNYTVLLFDSDPEVEREILRRIKLSDDWLRFLSIRADEQAPPTDEERDALVEARKEYLRRAAEREAQEAAQAAAAVAAPAAPQAEVVADDAAASEAAPAENPAENSEVADGDAPAAAEVASEASETGSEKASGQTASDGEEQA